MIMRGEAGGNARRFRLMKLFLVAVSSIVLVLFLVMLVLRLIERNDQGLRVRLEGVEASEILNSGFHEVKDPVISAYAFEKNIFSRIPSLEGQLFNTSRDGKLPGFIYDGGYFVVLRKGKNSSRGMLLCDRFLSLPAEFELDDIGQGRWLWTLDLEK